MHRRAVAIALAGLAHALPSLAQDSLYRRTFDLADRDAQKVVARFRCVAELEGRVRNSPLRRLREDADVICVEVPDQRRIVGVIVQTDSTWKRPTRFVAIDPDFGGHLLNPMDTADVLVQLRAQRYAEWLDAKRGDTARTLPTVVYRADSLIHVWIVPKATLPAPMASSPARVGGERHYVFPADAKRELFVVPPPEVRPVKGQVGAEWIIESRDSIPTFSELLMAHMLRMDERPVSIVTPTRIAKLTGAAGIFSGVGLVGWVITPRKP